MILKGLTTGLNMTDDELKKEIEKYKWFHNFKLNDNISIDGCDVSERNTMIETAISRIEFTDRRVLDVGCRDGYFSFLAEKKKAKEVYAIDNCISNGAVNLLIPYFNSKVKMEERGMFDLNESDGKFDIILFVGVLYHLRYPFWGLKLLADRLNDGGWMILESAITADKRDIALLHCPSSDESPYKDGTSVTFFNIKGLTDALESVGIKVNVVTYRDEDDYLTDSEDKIIRACLICTKVGVKSEVIDAYWRGDSHDRLNKNNEWNPSRCE
jgi:SAM-dependent methyltransferase